MTDSPLLSPALREYAHARYAERAGMLSDAGFTMPAALDGDRLTLMRLLAGTLPLTDLLDRDSGTLLDCIDHSLDLRRDRAWTAALAEDTFIHYVFWPRINNERLEAYRSRIGTLLEPRVAGLTMERAAVETNYWCAEHVTYSPTDGRTLSPVGALHRGVGRCGEESTLLVGALRSIGIPARQVYTPRWAHCDDNHAWVEALIDGTWRFMGACEPEERLDRGWFDHAAARAMLVHSRVFCDFTTGTVDVSAGAGEERDTLLENLTASYAPVTRLDVSVRHADGSAVSGAVVAFELLNMAEFTPIASLETDARGHASIEMGRGSVLVRASFGEAAAQAVVDTSCDDAVTLTLAEPRANERRDDAMPASDASDGVTDRCGSATVDDPAMRSAASWTSMTLVAPAGGASRAAQPTDEERERGADRAACAERLRVRRLADFAAASHTGDARLDALLERAGGNWHAIADFVLADGAADPDRLALLESLAVKDLADTPREVLDDAYRGAQAVRGYACRVALARLSADERDTLWRDCVLNPRVRYEELNGDRLRVQRLIGDRDRAVFRDDPRSLWSMLSTFVDDGPDELPLSDTSLLRLRRGSRSNVAIAFVSICRALGVPARLDPETGEPQFFSGTAFRSVVSAADGSGDTDTEHRNDSDDDVTSGVTEGNDMEHDTDTAKPVRLRLTAPTREQTPRYYVDYTVGVLTDTPHGLDYATLDLSEATWHDGALEVTIDEGDYRIVTTTRLPNGSQFASTLTFDTRTAAATQYNGGHDARTIAIALHWREPADDDLLEHLPLERHTVVRDGQCMTLGEVIDRPTVLFVLDAHGSEPSIHVLDELHDLLERDPQPPARPLIALCPGGTPPSDTLRRMIDRLPVAPEVLDCDRAVFHRMARILFVDPDHLPLTVALLPGDAGAQPVGVYACSGYNVGSVELATRLAHRAATLQ